MTLIELMVVVAVIGLLAVTVLPATARSKNRAAGRSAAGALASLIASIQTDAMANGMPVGFRLAPAPQQSGVLDIQTIAQEEFVVDVDDVFVIGPITNDAGQRAFPQGLVAVIQNILSTTQLMPNGTLLRFDGKGPWYTYIPTIDAESLPRIARLTAYDPWPGTVQSVRARLRPQPTADSVGIGSGLCVDMVWCGHGNPASYRAGATRFYSVNPNGDIVADRSVDICFDPAGRLQSVWRTDVNHSQAPVKPVGLLMMLVGTADRAGQAYDSRVSPQSRETEYGANWQYPDSYWIAVDPSTGGVRTAPTIPYSSDVIASQALIRTRSENVQH